MIVLGAATAPWPARAEGPLQLEVLLNGKPSGLIGAFWQDAKGGLSAKRKELEELHLKVPDRYGAEDEVALAEPQGFPTAMTKPGKASISPSPTPAACRSSTTCVAPENHCWKLSRARAPC
jgi:hypothetical protein